MTIYNFTVQPGVHSLELMWTTPNLPCLDRFMARVCMVLDQTVCKTSFVSRDRDR